MAALTKFNCFVEDLAEGNHNLGADALKVMLTNTAPTAANATTTDITEIAAGNGYSAGGAAVTVTASSQTSGAYTLVANDVVITASGGSIGPFRYAVLYNFTPAGAPLIAWADYGSSITLLAGESFTLDLSAAGVLGFTLVDAATLALIDAFTTAPSAARVGVINDLVTALKTAGVWDRLDFLRVYAAETSQAAHIDWIDPSRSGTAVNSPTFTADRGFTCDASTQYLDTGFVPSTHAVQMTGTDIMLAAYERSNVASAGRVMGVNSGTTYIFDAISRNASDQISARLNNGTLTALKSSVTDGRGFTGWQREGGSNGEGVKNGTVEAAAALAGTVTSTIPALPIFVNARNAGGTPANIRGSDYALVAGGRSLTDTQWADFYTAVQAYMTAVGANV